MNRCMLIIVCVFAGCVCNTRAVDAQLPFKNKVARDARKAYEEAIRQARDTYIERLDMAIKEAGSEGDLDDANRIKDELDDLKSEKVNVEHDETARNMKRLEGTRWGPSPNLTLRLLSGNRVVFSDGDAGVWILSDPHTLLLQRRKNMKIAVWQFDSRLRTATTHRFAPVAGEQGEHYKRY